MKKTKRVMLLALVLMISVMSCNNEELFVESVIEEVVDEEEIVEGEDEIEEEQVLDASLPCDFNLNNVEQNSTIIIDCFLDLEGEIINLPAGVTLEFDGGDITNGTLYFSDGSFIGGELLSSSLTIAGTKPQLKDPIFNFDPKRWGIVEGETTSEIAQRNNDILESIMFQAKELGVSTFKIGRMDAYFEVSKVTSTTTNQNFYPSLEAVNIPSDFNLVMSDETILRVFPTQPGAASLLGIREASNVTITGGVLYGDRDVGDYLGDNREWGAHLLTIRSGSNVVLDGIKFTMGSVGGLNINSQGFSFEPGYDPSNNITVKNCVFEKNRMISLALTDGRDILIENNEFIDTAQPTQNSDGGVVGYAIDMEPVRKRDPNTGELVYYQRVQDITIRGNKERGSRIGAFTIYVGDNIIIENNDFENVVGWSYASNSKIRNNVFNASSISNDRPAILAAGYGDTVFNNEISGNTISGYGSGMTIYSGGIKIFDNSISDFINGLMLFEQNDAEIYDNRIVSTKPNSRGITIQLTSADNVLIKTNTIDVVSKSLNFSGLNQDIGDELNQIIVENNTLLKTVSIGRSSGIIFRNNNLFSEMQIYESTNLDIRANEISNSNGDGIKIGGASSSDISVTGNNINYSLDCIKLWGGVNENMISLSENICKE